MEASAARDDGRLLAAAASGDAEAAEEICRRHRPAVYRAALRIVRTEQDADDVAQSTLVRALSALQRRPPRALPPLRARPPRELQPWLLAIARNESLSLLRARPDALALPDAADEHG